MHMYLFTEFHVNQFTNLGIHIWNIYIFRTLITMLKLGSYWVITSRLISRSTTLQGGNRMIRKHTKRGLGSSGKTCNQIHTRKYNLSHMFPFSSINRFHNRNNKGTTTVVTSSHSINTLVNRLRLWLPCMLLGPCKFLYVQVRRSSTNTLIMNQRNVN